MVPFASDGLGGVTEMDVSAALVTVAAVEPLTPLSAADMVAAPTATPVMRP